MDLLIFPNQLFENHPGLELSPSKIVLIEDSLFFGDAIYQQEFHLQKLWLHRTSMKQYGLWLQEKGFEVVYVDHDSSAGSLKMQLENISDRDFRRWQTVEPVDFVLEKRLIRAAKELRADLRFLPNPGFLNTSEQNQTYRSERKRWHMADFYKVQRCRLDVLMDGEEPIDGKWSFDEENRKKVPKKKLNEIPELPKLENGELKRDQKTYVEKKYSANPGSLAKLIYPVNHEEAKEWLDNFLTMRLGHFGDYEDAIVGGENSLWHSVLTPMLNIGLLTPEQVLQQTLDFTKTNPVSINNLEGFVRQLIGWREFVRATYDDIGVPMRNGNEWNHTRPLSPKFYDGTTGIPPVDDCIHRVLETGYCHHIERLMVLGGMMFVCEFDPNDIYKWFMEMFVDSYDWVMVPNVYGMSQNADGGLITTKPYFSGSAYIRKMSHYPKGEWCDIWDGLYWRWIWNNRDRLSKNHRWSMPCRMVEKMDESKRKLHLLNAEEFLEQL